MKQAILIVVLIAGLLTAAFFEDRFIKNSFNELEQKVSSFRDNILLDEQNIDTEQNKEVIENLIAFWEQKEETLFMFLSHEHLEDISINLYTAKVAIEFNDAKKHLFLLS